MTTTSGLDRDRAEFTPEAQLDLYESLDAWALALGDGATEALMALTGSVVVNHGTVSAVAHDPDLATAARKVAIRWLRDQGVT